MKILIFGVSNVGKTTIGKILAHKINYKFYDIDEETKKYYHTTLVGFQKRYPDLQNRDKARAKLLNRFIDKEMNIVVAITPTTYIQYYFDILRREDVIVMEFVDSPTNIFNRLIFTDDNDVVLSDSEEYRNKHKQYYLREIMEDINYYGRVYNFIENKININNRNPNDVADEIMNRYSILL